MAHRCSEFVVRLDILQRIRTHHVHRNRSRAHHVRRALHASWCNALLRRSPFGFGKCMLTIMFTSLPKVSLTSSLVQILFVSGLALIIGPQKTFAFFARKQKIRGSICFFGGILLVFLKWPFIGMIVETFGFLNLFGCVLPRLQPLIPPFTDPMLQRLLPSCCNIPAPATLHWKYPFVAVHSRGPSTQCSPPFIAHDTACSLSTASLVHAHQLYKRHYHDSCL